MFYKYIHRLQRASFFNKVKYGIHLNTIFLQCRGAGYQAMLNSKNVYSAMELSKPLFV